MKVILGYVKYKSISELEIMLCNMNLEESYK